MVCIDSDGLVSFNVGLATSFIAAQIVSLVYQIPMDPAASLDIQAETGKILALSLVSCTGESVWFARSL